MQINLGTASGPIDLDIRNDAPLEPPTIEHLERVAQRAQEVLDTMERSDGSADSFRGTVNSRLERLYKEGKDPRRMTDEELLAIRHMGRKSVDAIRRLQWDCDSSLDVFDNLRASDPPKECLADSIALYYHDLVQRGIDSDTARALTVAYQTHRLSHLDGE